MKKLLCLCLLVPLFLCSCGGDNKNIELHNLSFSFDFINNKSSYSINALVYEDGKIKYTVLKPQEIKGMELEFTDTIFKIHFLGIENEYPIEYIEKSVLSKIHRAFWLLINSEGKKSFNSDKIIVSDNDTHYTFTLTELSIPIALEFQNYKIEFKNIREE